MDKVRLFLVADGVVIVGFAAYIIYVLFLKKPTTHFKEDIWKNKGPKPVQKTGRSEINPNHEEMLDIKILEFKSEKEEPQRAKEPFKAPNFRGMPHEILGIPKNSEEEIISKAHKYWIKRYHPDRVTHLGEKYIEQARKRAEQLNTARNELLKAFRKS